ncbi:MAG TPA: DUF6089 family protein [Saprospiraceae bacterium]|nr:DUF6089 family protein [Saprospiraceae bacterium]
MFLPYCGFSQNIDFGISLGGSNYSGDLTESVMVSIRQTHPCLGIHGRVEWDPLFSLRLQFNYLQLSGDDAYSERPGNVQRNLNFRSSVQELNAVIQLQPLNIFSTMPRRLSPYLQFGLAGFHFNPHAEYRGSRIALQPLGTEGQGLPGFEEPYKLYSYALIFGAGLRYFVNESWSLGMEALARQTGTDYLDDASTNYLQYEQLFQQRGFLAAELGNKIRASSGTKRANPADKDWYQSIALSLSYHLGKRGRTGSPKLRKHQIHCPSF